MASNSDFRLRMGKDFYSHSSLSGGNLVLLYALAL